MAFKIIDGKLISKQIKEEVKLEVLQLIKKNIQPTLAVILVGENQASKIYVKNKKKACEETNIKSISYELPENTSEEQLLALISEINNDNKINGILVQLPLPKHIDESKVLVCIKPEKDVDGFHPYNIGLLETGLAKLKPCTPSGIIELLKRSNIDIEGKNCVVIGRSNIVGKPVASLLLAENGTVTITHSKTKNLQAITSSADILVSAIGKANFVTSDMVKQNAVVIDVGINRVEGKLCGDVFFDDVCEKTSFITPVPGGVGPMTIAMLMLNCLKACKMQN